MPTVGIAPMQAHLNDLSRQLGPRTHALLVLDQAGWHTSARLVVPRNLTLLALPPRSPELNPAEMLWRELRQLYLSNRVYGDQAALDRAVGRAWCALASRPDRVARLCNFGWLHTPRNKARRHPKT